MEIFNNDYVVVLNNLKQKIIYARQKAVLSLNKEVLSLYWEVGNIILEKQKLVGWGSKIIDSLSNDLKKAFPDLKGFSSRNLKYMRKFAEVYNDFEIVQPLVAQLPWSHNLILMEKVPDFLIRKWYIEKAIENG